MSLFNKIDLTISYTETGNYEAERITEYICKYSNIYNYRNFLDGQSGLSVKQIALDLYVNYPCIVLATRDWYEREATIFEAKCLKSNLESKLVFDFEGNFVSRSSNLGICKFTLGDFDNDSLASLESVMTWFRKTFPLQFEGY